MALETVTVAADTLERFVGDIFDAAGCRRDEADRISHYLLSANLTGHDSHGVIRTPRYVQYLRTGLVRAGQSMTIAHETATHATVDGNRGFGQTITPQAVDLGIAKAREMGLSVIGLRNVGHIGRVGDWGERAAAAGLVSIHFVNAVGSQLVAPFGGVDRRFSTNPICIGIPQDDRDPLILDFATSLVAEGKVLVASNGGKPVPPGSLIEPDGTLSADPRTLYGEIEGTHERNSSGGKGALRAFGEHKGSGLAFMCEILAGCLTGGGATSPDSAGGKVPFANGLLSIYLSPGGFGTQGFEQAARDCAAFVKSSRPSEAGAEVLVPGEPEARTRAHRLAHGIPVQVGTWSALTATARELGVTVPN